MACNCTSLHLLQPAENVLLATRIQPLSLLCTAIHRQWYLNPTGARNTFGNVDRGVAANFYLLLLPEMTAMTYPEAERWEKLLNVSQEENG